MNAQRKCGTKSLCYSGIMLHNWSMMKEIGKENGGFGQKIH